MSTQPIERRHVRVVSRRSHLRRALTIGVLCAATFALAFLVGHTHGARAGGERLPASLPKVPTPVSASLLPAPPIELGVLKPPPPPPATHKTTTRTPPPVTSTPAVTTPATSRPVETAAPTETAPPPPARKTEAPVQSTPSGSSGSAGGSTGKSGSGTSFESSD